MFGAQAKPTERGDTCQYSQLLQSKQHVCIFSDTSRNSAAFIFAQCWSCGHFWNHQWERYESLWWPCPFWTKSFWGSWLSPCGAVLRLRAAVLFHVLLRSFCCLTALFPRSIVLLRITFRIVCSNVLFPFSIKSDFWTNWGKRCLWC